MPMYRPNLAAHPAVAAYNTACQVELNAVPTNVRNQISAEMTLFKNGVDQFYKTEKGGSYSFGSSHPYVIAARRWYAFLTTLGAQYATVADCLHRWSRSFDPVRGYFG